MSGNFPTSKGKQKEKKRNRSPSPEPGNSLTPIERQSLKKNKLTSYFAQSSSSKTQLQSSSSSSSSVSTHPNNTISDDHVTSSTSAATSSSVPTEGSIRNKDKPNRLGWLGSLLSSVSKGLKDRVNVAADLVAETAGRFGE